MRTSESIPSRLEEALGSKYEVLHWIGGGGMAQVYLARNRTTGGLFAVKVLADHLSGEDAIVARFLQEARTSAALSGHPNIVSIFDVGQLESTHYIIMQYVEGEDLKACLKRRGKLPPEEAAGIIEQIAEALVFAHSRAVVHRDLKPSNIKIQNSGRVVVLDFGIAKAGDAPSQLTTAGQCVGTPYYMSPEQFLGGACDARSDLYSLGVVFFELLTGRRPFDGESTQQIEAAHRSHPSPSPCDLESTIPAEYCRIVLRLLEKRPENRYQTAAGLISELRKLRPDGAGATNAAAQPPAALPAAPLPEIPAGRPRNKALYLYAGVAAALAAAALFFLTIRTGDSARTGAPNPAAVSAASKIDAEAVTNTAYKAFCDQTGRPYPDPAPDDPNYFYARPEAPVLNVAYRDAEGYAIWAGKRLPTEAERDSAVRAGSGQPQIAEWTSSPFTPSQADNDAFRKLAGTAPAGPWVVVKGSAALRGMPTESRLRGIAIGFRCVKDAARR